jgi:hypothetical protein
MQETEALVGALPYVTRLYTTMSPADMTLDPVFDFNTDLADVSNQHVAERTIYCSEDVWRNEAPWKAELPSGQVVHGQGNSWPLTADDDFPAALEVRQEHNSGEGDTIDDNLPAIEAVIDEHNDSVPINTGGGSSGGGGGCHTTGTGAPAGGGLALVLLIGCGLVTRQRRLTNDQ